MSEFVRVAAVDELQPGQGMQVEIQGQVVAVFNVAGTFRAIGNRCAHRGGPLAQGSLDGDIVLCPWHSWGYDTRDGACEMNSEFKVPSFPVKVEDGQVWVASDQRRQIPPVD